jgi:hypothetical protein
MLFILQLNCFHSIDHVIWILRYIPGYVQNMAIVIYNMFFITITIRVKYTSGNEYLRICLDKFEHMVNAISL